MIVVTSAEMQILSRLSESVLPRAHVDTWDWICDKGRMPDGTPFDGERIPWCRGVCGAWDDPETRQLTLQWGTRLGKTTIGTQIHAKCRATTSRPGLFATSTESLAKRTVKNKFYKVLENCPETLALMLPEHLRPSDEIKLRNGSWAVAWSGSPTRLADVEAYFGWANEVDKWSLDEALAGEAGEGDSWFQFLERFKEHLDYKIGVECSPSTEKHSRINKELKASNNCRYNVPCPNCGAYQVLRLGKEGEPGGIRFDRMEGGESDPDLARKSARYVCAHCKYEIYDDQRSWMMQRGVWVPEGCHADKRGRVKGNPKRGPRLWGGQLSSLYSLQLRWGNIAEKFLLSKGDQRKLRMFVNGWLAETWTPHKARTKPEKLGERITVDVPRGVIPKWATWVFAAVDRQLDHFVYWVEAVDADEREHLIDHGTYDTLDEIEEKVIRRRFEHADGKEPLWPAETFVDSGYETKEMYEFCQRFKGTPHKVTPCKGANTDCAGEAYQAKVIGDHRDKTARTKRRLMKYGKGLTLVRVNPWFYEPIIQRQIDSAKPDESECLTLHEDCREDLALLKDLCNGAESKEPSKSDPDKHRWVKAREDDPNDFRDCKKYARCCADYHFRHDWRKAKKRQRIATTTVERQDSPAVQEHTGRQRRRFRPATRLRSRS